MAHSATEPVAVLDLERIVVASVAITARALAEVAPELTFVQWRVLVLVDQAEGVAIGSVATSLGAKIAAVSRLVGRLRERGLVATHRATEDARVVLVTLTRHGADLRDRVVERRRVELRSAIAAAGVGRDAEAAIDRLAAILEAIG